VSCETFSEGDSVIHRADPRMRIVAGVAFSVLVAVSDRFAVLGASLAIAVALAVVAWLPVVATLKRLGALNIFMAAIVVLVPPAYPGREWFRLGPIVYTAEGFSRAAGIVLKGNAIVLCLTVMLSTMEITTVGHALAHLRVPDKLTQLFLFTVRYVDVLHHEYRRLANAMKVRCFKAHLDVHSLRSLGHLVGMLLVKGFDRSERIVAAMKCRGFRGKFWVLHHFAVTGRDVAFGAVSFVVLVLLVLGQWL